MKSPLLGFDDDDLIALAPDRDGSLWQALHEARAERYRKAVETLQRWRTLSARLAPYEFFAALLDSEGYRSRILARLGPDAADPIDEFLNSRSDLASTRRRRCRASLRHSAQAHTRSSAIWSKAVTKCA